MRIKKMTRNRLLTAMLMSCLSYVAFAQMSGSGTSDDPYQVRTAFDLFDVRSNLSAYYKLMNDIDLTEWIAEENPSQGWTPIGTGTSPFTGVFDGNNKSIKGLYIKRTGMNDVGLFGYIGKATIKSLCLINPMVEGQNNVGAIVGRAYSITSFVIKDNSCIGGKVKGNNYVGGIIGTTYSSIRPSQITNYIEGNYSSSSVIGNMCCGGIAGGVQAIYSEYHDYDFVTRYNIVPQIRDNHFGGKVNASSYVAAIVGELFSAYKIGSSIYTIGNLSRNIGGGVVIGGDKTTGILGYKTGYSYNGNNYTFSFNVCVADTISGTANTNRVSPDSQDSYTDNYAYVNTVVIRNGVVFEVQDNNWQGSSLGYNTLRRKNTYVGFGFDFSNQWAISEGVSLPYNINQSEPPIITQCSSGKKAKVAGTAAADGVVHVFVGDKYFSGVVTDGEWEVSLGELEDDATVRVSFDSDDLMSSIMTTAVAESPYYELDENSTTPIEASEELVSVRVKRTIKANEWSTICLPFAMTEEQMKSDDAFGSDVQLADFNDYTYDNTEGRICVHFQPATAIEANHPYVIKVSQPVSQFTVDGVDIDPQEAIVDFDTSRRKNQPRQFVGTYVANTILDWGTLFLSGNKFWYSIGETKMKAFRAYFNFIDLIPDFEDNYDARIVMSFDEETTGVNDRMTMPDDKYYNLNGQRVKPASKGLYIRNGKKVVIK